ncbi:hypothetical protein DV737_g1335, partial [Chaetothyriales sp. CBS 132003]
MSFTVYTKKRNGDTVPIKLSIWDALHGCPNPSRKKKKNACVCCGKYHGETSIAKSHKGNYECVPNKGNDSVVNTEIEGEMPASKEAKSSGDKLAIPWTPSRAAFTQEDDEIILRMKGQVPPLPWTKIAEVLGGKWSKGDINERYRELKARLAGINGDDRKPGENSRRVSKNHKADKAGDVDIRDDRYQQAEATKNQDQVHESIVADTTPTMSKLSDSLKALINAAYARPGTVKAPPNIKSIYQRIADSATEHKVGVPVWLTISTAATTTMNSPSSLLQLHALVSGQPSMTPVQAAELMREVGLKCISFNGIPRTINCLGAFKDGLPKDVHAAPLEKAVSLKIAEIFATLSSRAMDFTLPLDAGLRELATIQTQHECDSDSWDTHRRRANGQRANSQRTNSQRANSQRTNSQRTNSQRANGQRANSQRANGQCANGQRANDQRANNQRDNNQRANNQRDNNQRANDQRANDQRINKRRASKLCLSHSLGRLVGFDAHNIHRANHSVVYLKWNSTMEQTAKQISETCYYAHSRSAGDGVYGQNIGAGFAADDIASMVGNAMYNGEIELYPGPYGEDPDMTNFESWGHYSQIVWSDTTDVGCWTTDCSATGLQNVASEVGPVFTVCNYYPPGNVVGEFGAKVPSPGDMPIVVIPSTD